MSHHPHDAVDASAANTTPSGRAPLFRSFFMGGFECSTHVLRSGRRLDLLASTRHDVFAALDYERLRRVGMDTARDGIVWHRIEREPGHYDFDDTRRMVRAALDGGLQVIWDLLHFGWPDHVDVFAADFPARFAAFSGAFARILREEGDPAPAVIPINEISFISFAGGEAGFFNPFRHGQGDRMKRQLVLGWIAAARAMREIHPGAVLIHSDPLIFVRERPQYPEDGAGAAGHREAQYHAFDMILGRRMPELGGGPELLDALGLNYYVYNQWYFPGGHDSMIPPSSPHRRPLRELLEETYERYRLPLFIGETGIEDDARPAWLAYVAHEVRAAIRRGVDLQGICLYPVVNHAGWDDDRHCHNGLWDYSDDRGERAIDPPLAGELERQQEAMQRLRLGEDEEPPSLARLDPIAHSIAEATEASREV